LWDWSFGPVISKRRKLYELESFATAHYATVHLVATSLAMRELYLLCVHVVGFNWDYVGHAQTLESHHSHTLCRFSPGYWRTDCAQRQFRWNLTHQTSLILLRCLLFVGYSFVSPDPWTLLSRIPSLQPASCRSTSPYDVSCGKHHAGHIIKLQL
jgi:hypothetical protein